MDNPEGRYHRASWLPVIAADILPIVRLDIRNERIHILDILHVDDSPDLLELFGSHQHVTCSRYGINDIHGRPAMFLDGLPEIVGKFGRHGISQRGRWMDDSSIPEPIDEGQKHWTRTLDRISPRR